MAEIILEPTILSKVIPLSLKTNEVDSSLVGQLITNSQFNTADTDAWFSFTLDGLAATTGTFDLALINLNDKSVFNHTAKVFNTNPFYYKLDSGTDELTNEIRHAGKWVGQLTVTLPNGDSATRKFIFAIEGHILDGTVVQTILLEDYNALISDIEASKDELTQYNVDYASLIATVTSQEAARVQNELTRTETFNTLVNSEIIAQNVATELQNVETTYAPRLLSAEQQLEQTSSKADIAAAKADAMASGAPKAVYGTLALLQAAYPTGTIGAYLVAADGNWYYWSGTAWTSGGLYQSRGVESKSITKDDTSFIVTGKNRFDAKTVISGYYVDWQTGNLVANGSYNVSPFVYIEDLDRFTNNYHNSICFYGESENYLAGINGSGTSGSGYTIVPGEIVGQNAEGTYTRPANAVWARVTIDPSIVGRLQIEDGEVVTPFQNYYVTVPDMEKVDDNVKNVIFKTTASQYDITFGKARYIFKRQTDATRALDTWRIYQGDVVDTDNKIVGNMFIDSDIEGAMKEVGVADFIGGYHGDETFSSVTLLVDGKILDTSPATFNIKFKTLDIFVVSKMYHCATVNEAFDRVKHLHFEKEVLTVSNKLTVLSTFVVERAALGLFNCYKSYNSVPLITHYSENVGMSLKTMPDNLSDSNFETSVELDKVTLYGNGFTMHMNMEMALPSTYQGTMTNFGSQNRIKVYFDVIKSVAGGTTLTAGAIIKSAFSIAII